ncbi:putative 3-hydroxybutyryl- dehydrogenase protein [Phaeoacremonium minimum UCRPA7]|uniref:Putative 3-hydroxybutyryl-dehydrogenase protein n=1 Tax=Phaeoacremonium minimum (strain UCR-PA7) TaxID=1286976 RepID=R8BP60_PHAM7|nr:putative 3-hydroxybutyryl- dehydrogenase protein [Phaeoacremonium minimum UCRPA7]EOO01122.1 putative 3-hydroxybutyryl- dehydrogenase protein [Phaeoacremonium minimum UCRPA7]
MAAKPAARWPEYKSPYGPKYEFQPNVMGVTGKQLFGLGARSAAFGGVALFAVIFYASGIPRVQKDILQKVPVIGGYFVNEIPASDNPF